MRNTLKATTLESKLPLLAVEHGCIISKDADITVAFEVSLPELFTVTSQEYEAMHGAWCKAIKVLPHYSVAHKQDWFVSENYKPELQKDNLSFLDRSFERHFNERPYLAHKCYLFLTKTTKERMRQQSNFSTLCRGRITPKELNHEMVVKFMESVEQFERIINDTGYIRLRRLSDDELVGTDKASGLIEKYMSLTMDDVTCLEDIDLDARQMRIGDKMLCLHTLSDTDITESLTLKADSDNSLTGDLLTFGKKHDDPTHNFLVIRFRMSDGSIHEVTTDVTEQIVNAPDPMNVNIIIDDITLPDTGEEPPIPGEGLDVTVGDWIDIEIYV